jgi:hypothetical protein
MADTLIVFNDGRIVGTHEVSEFSDVAALAHQIARDVVTARSDADSPPLSSR